MKAFFTTTRNVIEQAIESESRHHESGLNVELSEEGECVVVEGAAQTLMFLIGELAGYGEDGLVKIES